MKSITRLLAVVCLCSLFSFADEKKPAAPTPATAAEAATTTQPKAGVAPELTPVESKEMDLLIEQGRILDARMAELAKDPAVARFLEVQRSRQEASEREQRFFNAAVAARHLQPNSVNFDTQKRTITGKLIEPGPPAPPK